MSWYYGVDGRRQGPVEETALEALELSGGIEWTTPIWREGMPAWKPFGAMFGRASVRWEGLASEETTQYCGFWIRFCARMLDGLILGTVTLPLSLTNQVITMRSIPFTDPGAEMNRLENSAFLGPFLTIQAGFLLASLILAFAYEVFFVGRFGGTPGKLLLRMRIVRADFSRLTYGRAAIRFFGRMLTELTMYIGYIMVGFDPQRRALHDYVADTRVIKRDQDQLAAQPNMEAKR
jgi:uncharacterized RDD family membrane protein YckC